MKRTSQEIGAYGFVNGLGFQGDPAEKAKLLRRVGRAIERGDFEVLLEYLAAYGIGAWAGSFVQRAALNSLSCSDLAGWG